MNFVKQAIRKIMHLWGMDPYFVRLQLQGLVRFQWRTRTYVREVCGSHLHLNGKDNGLSRSLARDGIREKESVDALFEHVTPDMNILDLGANIGFYVVLEGQIVKRGSGKIVAIEPGPDNFRLLELNVESNNLSDKATLIHGAVTAKSGIAKLHLSDMTNCHRLEEFSTQSSANVIEVPGYTFVDLESQGLLDISKLDFLRMDVEGAEYSFLPQIIEQLAGRDRFLMFVEFHPWNHLDTHCVILKDLESMGFSAVSVIKEYMKDGHVVRQPCPKASIQDLYQDEFYTQFGGCEVFLKK